MSRKFVVLEQPKKTHAQESLIDKVAEYYEIDSAFKQLGKGIESYETISKLYDSVKSSKEFTTGLESSVSLTLEIGRAHV